MTPPPCEQSAMPEPRLLDLPDPPAIPATPEFLELCAGHGIAFDDGDINRLGRFLALLLAANERFNLTAIRDPEQAWIRHVFDSLTLLAVLAEIPEPARVIDVGAGGGLPSIPLAITIPHQHFTLLEATGKKAEFLRLAIDRLEIANARVLPLRAEAAGHMRTGNDALRERHDAAIARALGPIRVAAELTSALVKVGGLVALIKGQKADDELADARHAMRELRLSHDATLDTPTGRIVVLTKVAPSPKIYPRRDGEPKRCPL